MAGAGYRLEVVLHVLRARFWIPLQNASYKDAFPKK